MGQLTNQYVSQSYQGLLNLENPFTGVTNTLQYVTDGIGNKLPMLASTSSIVITGSFRGDGSGLTGVTVTLPSGVVSGSAQIVDLGFATTSSLNTLSGSIATTDLGQNNRLTSIEGITGSLATTGSLNSYTLTSSFNAYTSSNDSKVNSLISQTGSYVTETESGSFVTSVTGLTDTITITKGNGSQNSITVNNVQSASFANNATSASFAQNALSASYAPDISNRNGLITTGSIGGNQSITGSLNVEGTISATSASITYLQTVYETASIIYSSGSNQLGDASDDVQTLWGTVNLPTGPLVVTGSVTATNFTGSLQGTASYATNAISSSHAINADVAISSSQAQNAVSASHSEYSDDAGLLNGTGSGVFATTGSNSFVGNQNITGSVNISGSSHSVIGDVGISGSLIVSGSETLRSNLLMYSLPSTYNATVQPGQFITSSLPVSQSNFIFATSAGAVQQGSLLASQTGSILLSGSNNILFNSNRTNTIAQGTLGYIGGNNNIINQIPTLNTGSTYRPTMANNIIAGATTLNFTTSSLLNPSLSNNLIFGGFTANMTSGALSANQNVIVGSVVLTHTVSQGVSSSAYNNNFVNGINQNITDFTSSIVNAANNNFAGALNTINNYFHNPSGINNQLAFNRNMIMGQGNTIHFSGSTAGGTRAVGDSFFGGLANEISSSLSGSNDSNVSATFLYGRGLTINGSSPVTTGGSAFVGRFNDTGSLSRTQDIVFAVGTGTGTSNRRTGLYIDSGSNVVTSGSFRSIGNATITGSLIASGSFSSIGNATITGSLNVTGDVLFASGSNKTMGTAVLDGGSPSSVVVSNSLVTSNSLIFLTKQNLTNHASVSITSKGSGTFTIGSSHNGDSDTVGYLIINPS